MQIAQVLAGYSLGQADLLRRAMGKKKPEEMARQREVFVSGAVQRDVPQAVAMGIFDLMEKFAGYGFNKSHSAAYALISYQTAWLKALYPAQFMAAVLSSDMDNTDKLLGLVRECRRLGLTVHGPDINRSSYRFSVDDQGAIRYGLGAVKGVGAAAVENIVDECSQSGGYADALEFCRRIDLKKVNRRALEALVKAGALDALDERREQLLANLPRMLDDALRHSRDADAGQSDLFGDSRQTVSPAADLVQVPPWSARERYAAEREALGLYLTGHPMETYREELQGLVPHPLKALQKRFGQRTRVAGLVVGIRRITRRGIVAITVEDETDSIEVTLPEAAYAECRDAIQKDAVVVAVGSVETDRFSGGCRLAGEGLWSLAAARGRFAARLDLRVETAGTAMDALERLIAVIEAHRGGPCQVNLVVCNGTVEAPLRLASGWAVKADEALLEELESQAGVTQARLGYAPP